MITRNWREKLISLMLAFLFWYMIKAEETRATQMHPSARPVPAARL